MTFYGFCKIKPKNHFSASKKPEPFYGLGLLETKDIYNNFVFKRLAKLSNSSKELY